MKIQGRILSTLLAVILMVSALSMFSVIGVSAATADKEEEMDDEAIEDLYVKTVYKTPEQKLATMTPVSHMENEHSKLYVDTVSGEIAVEDIATGDIMFSNPYDVASSKGSASTKKRVLSQIVIQYVDNGTTKYLYSFEEAAMRNQIRVLNIKNGIRVEYTIGREETRKLVPRWISSENFKRYIEEPLQVAADEGYISEWMRNKLVLFYSRQDLSEQKSQKARDQLLKAYPIVEEFPIYTLSADITSSELNLVEENIKSYCEDYTFEQMDADHEECGYVEKDEQFPVFKMALEYSFDEKGALSVRLPCNGLRYDMASYTLEYIQVLPYMGAGNSNNAGHTYENYNFYPDGSGSLFDFEQLNTKATTTVRGKVYGLDFAYHNITGVTYQKAIRYPVYGTVASEIIHSVSYQVPVYDEDKNPTGAYTTVTEPVSNTVSSADAMEEYVKTVDKNAVLLAVTGTEEYQRGFVAVIESGESLAEIATYHAGSLSDYNAMMNYFNPKPKDSYDLADSISVSGTSTTWTVVSDRKYSGNITIRYQMLTDAKRGAAAKAEHSDYTFYDTSWLGMAEAYRDYLIQNGTLTKLEEKDVHANIPMYLEAFGALETKQQIATIPVDVMTPLTTFEDVATMFDELSEKGINNINFKLNGYANGGMYYTIPAKLKWEKAVGGASGFEELIQKTKDEAADGNQMSVFPDFDFAYLQQNTLTDGFTLKDDAVKTIDDRYSSFRQYSATQQSYVSFYQLAVSPSRYSKFYQKLIENYNKFGYDKMSVASLGTALNSDFDEDEPYNREDGKDNTVEAFKDLQAAGYSLMTEGANAYTWGYVDHIINVDLDSSRYIKSSASVPFIGAVLHGYVQFAGTPFNEEGDTDYAILRAIENGAGMYFILSYQNTQELKEDPFLSQYYSVRYDIWKDDLIEFYKELNTALKDVQTKVIIDHAFLVGERVLSPEEFKTELEKQLEKAEKAEEDKQDKIEIDKVISTADAYYNSEKAEQNIQTIIDDMKAINEDNILGNYNKLITAKNDVVDKLIVANNLKNAFDAMEKPAELPEGATEEEIEANKQEIATYEAVEKEVEAAVEALEVSVSTVKSLAVNVLAGFAALEAKFADAEKIVAALDDAVEVIRNSEMDDTLKALWINEIENVFKAAAELKKADAALQLIECNKLIDGSDAEIVPVIELALSIFTNQAYPNADENFNATEIFKTLCGDKILFTEEDIKAEIPAIKDEDDKDDTTTEDEDDKYVVDNNQIVVVTYGDRNSETFEKTAYKSFILNYNNFSVRVSYNGKSYTIPAGGYVVID